jgi:cell division protein FtsI/penicillin-binding protein 2
VLVLVLLGAAVGAGSVWQARRAEARSRTEAAEMAAAYLRDWGIQDWTAMRAMVASPSATFADAYTAVADGLHRSKGSYAPRTLSFEGDHATAPFDATVEVGGLGTWTYRGRLALVRSDGRWLVAWSPAAIHPSLTQALHFRRTRQWPERAPIMSDGDTPLVEQADVVVVGVQPGKIQDRQQVIDALQQYAGVDPATANARLDAPGVQPGWFVPMANLRPEVYALVKPSLYPVSGILFRDGKARLAVRDGFGRQVMGRVGEITEEALDKLGAPYEVGDQVGLSGLERAFESQLAGTPSGSIDLVDSAGKVTATVKRFVGTEPQELKLTLDEKTQEAAEDALAGVTEPAALVAVDTKTGNVRAVTNVPVDGINRAFSGHYPPGSTFKIVTTAALIAGGATLDQTITCPTEVTVGGKTFRNFEGESFGTITLRDAFRRSCNTAFIQLAEPLAAGDLEKAAEGFGFNSSYSLHLPVAGGKFPAPADDVEKAADAIGQGTVLASPVQMASVAAAVASGSWRPPRLMSTDPAGTPVPLGPGVAASLQELMHLVVTSGTGTAAFIPGLDVAGKTGTAQFGDGTQTHAWFVGFSGHLAFAVLVEGGGVGGQVAAPLARSFLEKLST